MEKVLYVLSFPDGRPDGLTASLVGDLAPALVDAGAHHVQVNVADADVAGATRLRMDASGAPADAVLGVWVDSANDQLRAPIDDAIRAGCPGADLSAYLVTESVPMANTRFPAALGERTHGMAHLAFIRRRPDLEVDEFLQTWLGSHTQVAIELQDTFAYVQHVVARVLVPGPVEWHAVVEECFPEAAMTDAHAFFDAVGDDERLARHQREMFESVQRFIDLSMLDVVPTSRYVCS
ncbi:MAG: EthD domain-containing protein [Acidimicrobiales bacterium]